MSDFIDRKEYHKLYYLLHKKKLDQVRLKNYYQNKDLKILTKAQQANHELLQTDEKDHSMDESLKN